MTRLTQLTLFEKHWPDGVPHDLKALRNIDRFSNILTQQERSRLVGYPWWWLDNVEGIHGMFPVSQLRRIVRREVVSLITGPVQGSMEGEILTPDGRRVPCR